jgi:hypothetical protein
MRFRKSRLTLSAAAFALAIPALPGLAEDTMPMTGDAAMGDTHRVRITYENLTASQGFSPGVFFTHDASAPPLFEEGKPAPFGLMRIAEEGNTAPLLAGEVVPHIGAAYGTAVEAIPLLPGQRRIVEIDVDAEHPMLTGAWMLGMTNDGFTGISGIDVYGLDKPMTMELMAWDAGTEKNNETKPFLIALMGTDRDPENGVVAMHEGIRGDADAPAEWKFDPSSPVARLTIEPVMESVGG